MVELAALTRRSPGFLLARGPSEAPARREPGEGSTVANDPFWIFLTAFVPSAFGATTREESVGTSALGEPAGATDHVGGGAEQVQHKPDYHSRC